MKRANNSLFGFGSLLLCGAIGLAILKWSNVVIDGVAWLDIAIATAGVVMLYSVLRFPWDLYMEARGLYRDQRESQRREMEISQSDIKYAQKTARWLLAFSLGSHLLCAAVALAVTTFSSLGYWFAGFFLLATLLRPSAIVYAHIKVRLLEMRQRARYPREDVVSLLTKVDTLMTRQAAFENMQEQQKKTTDEQLSGFSRKVQHQQAQLASFDHKVDRVCNEMTKSVERLTDDRELLRGMRTFVRMVKEA